MQGGRSREQLIGVYIVKEKGKRGEVEAWDVVDEKVWQGRGT